MEEQKNRSKVNTIARPAYGVAKIGENAMPQQCIHKYSVHELYINFFFNTHSRNPVVYAIIIFR